MICNVKTLKYIKKKRTNLYIFLKDLNKKIVKSYDDWYNIVKKFDKLQKYIIKEKIRETGDFIIYKEKYTNAWLLECKKMVIIYIIKGDKNNFEERIKDDLNYNFVIYETSFHYIYFCISHSTETMGDVLKNLLLEFTDKRILIISDCGKNFSSFVFLNKYIYDNYPVFKNISTWKNTKTKDYDLSLKVQIIIKYIIACKQLSPHYFPIHRSVTYEHNYNFL